MPPSFVTCYICGREFGTRSIGIHVPKCLEKWEAQQEKLPRGERRQAPSPPENYNKILSGEITGKELIRINQKAAEDYKTEVLEPCPVCGRTFLPEALLRHRNCCREEKPMSKNKGPGYTSRMKSKVNYPKLKPSKTNKQTSLSLEETQPPGSQAQSPSLIRKETITISKSSGPNDVENENPSIKDGVSKPPVPSSSINRKDTVVISKESTESKEDIKQKEVVREKEVLRKRETFRKNEDRRRDEGGEAIGLAQKDNGPPSKLEFIKLIETEAIFESEKHRRAILDMVTGYARNVRRAEILEVLDHEVFEDVDNLEEVLTILKEYVGSKTNNNDNLLAIPPIPVPRSKNSSRSVSPNRPIEPTQEELDRELDAYVQKRKAVKGRDR